MPVSEKEIRYGFLSKGNYKLINSVFKIALPKNIEKLTCYGAFYQSNLIGFTTLVEHEKAKYDIKFLEVLPIFRNIGIGSKLLTHIVSFCRFNNGKYIFAKYNSLNHHIKFVEHFFIKNDWNIPSYDYTYYRLPKGLFYNNFIQKHFNKDETQAHEDLKVVSLNQLNGKELASIEKKTKLLPRFLSPINLGASVSSELSLFAFKDEEIIAWLPVSKPINTNEVSIKSIYVREDYRCSALGLILCYALYKKAEKCSFFSNIKWCSFVFDKTDKRLRRLHQGLFKSYLDKDIDYYFVSKNI